MVDEVVGKTKQRLAKCSNLCVVIKRNAIVVKYIEVETLEKSLEKLVLGFDRARIFERKANEGWAIVPIAVSSRWIFGGFDILDDTEEPANCLGALLLVCEDGDNCGKVESALQ
jgi:hypothetical protein